MKYRNRFLPNNYVGLSESILGLSSVVGGIIKHKNYILSFDMLWKEFELVQQKNKAFVHHKASDVYLALNFLYMVGVVNIKDGKLFII
jgi:hypothetical protein